MIVPLHGLIWHTRKGEVIFAVPPLRRSVLSHGFPALPSPTHPAVIRGRSCRCVSFPFQAVNFTFYQIFKTQLSAYLRKDELAPWQHMLLGGLSGGIGPCVNNPLDVVKTRLQKQVGAHIFALYQSCLLTPPARLQIRDDRLQRAHEMCRHRLNGDAFPA